MTGLGERQPWRRSRLRNRVQSLLLILLMAGFMALLGWRLWGLLGLFILLAAALVSVAFNPALSPKWVMRLYGAEPLRPEQAPALYQVVEWLAQRAGLASTPLLYHLPSRVLNAFTVGSRRQSTIALSDALLRQLNLRELTGVLAHEISHIQHHDLWVMGLADLFSRLTSLLSLLGQFLLLLNLPLLLFGQVPFDWLLVGLLILAPLVSALAQLALSRTREYAADLNAAWLTGDPPGLASALRRIEQRQGNWLEHLLVPGRRVPDPSLLRTHPSTQQRIQRLLALELPADAPPPLPLDQLLYDLQRLRRRAQHAPRRRISGLWF